MPNLKEKKETKSVPETKKEDTINVEKDKFTKKLKNNWKYILIAIIIISIIIIGVIAKIIINNKEIKDREIETAQNLIKKEEAKVAADKKAAADKVAKEAAEAKAAEEAVAAKIAAEEKAAAEAKAAIEAETNFKASCKAYTFKEMARNPDTFLGTKVKLTGEVVQAMYDTGLTSLRVNITKGSYGYYSDTIYVTYAPKEGEGKILEEDNITLWGTSLGDTEYTSTMGATINLPYILALYITINE